MVAPKSKLVARTERGEVTTMQKHEWAILSSILDTASNEFSTHLGDNFPVLNDEKHRELARKIVLWKNPRLTRAETEEEIWVSQDGKELFFNNSVLMSYFSQVALIEAGKTKK